MANDSNKIKVEVAYALPEKQVLMELQVEPGTTAIQCINLSGLLEKFPDINLDGDNKLGIFGKIVKQDTELREHDRVEIYRPLIADPKEVRRKRAAEGKRMKKGGGDLSEEEKGS
ncbi:MAG: RnfH family protein [Gammaproteobacteria bacterium]|nr:RnfH family protein [Gammaproteobacteria bacterium]